MASTDQEIILRYLRQAEEMINSADTDPKFTLRVEAYLAVKSARLILEKQKS